jgi:hypothetical protein
MRREIDSLIINNAPEIEHVICRLPNQRDLCSLIETYATQVMAVPKSSPDTSEPTLEWDVSQLMFAGLNRIASLNQTLVKPYEEEGDKNFDSELDRERILTAGTFEVVCQSFLTPMAVFCRDRMLGAEIARATPDQWSVARLQLVALRIALSPNNVLKPREMLWPRELLPTRMLY